MKCGFNSESRKLMQGSWAVLKIVTGKQMEEQIFRTESFSRLLIVKTV